MLIKIYQAILCFAAFLAFTTQVSAQVHVNGYYKSNGTYVEPHERTSPNSTVTDNYSYPGNYNPNKDGYSSGTTTTVPAPSYAGSNAANTTNGLSILDLYLIHKAGDIKSAHAFLLTYKQFHFSGSQGKTSEGCEVFKWAQNRQTLEITAGNIELDGKYTPVFFIKYLIPVDEFSAFESQLNQLKFKKESQSVSKFGEPFTLWGAENVLELKLFCTMLKGANYEVTIMN